MTKCIATNIKDDEVNVRFDIKHLLNLASRTILVITRRVLPIHAMDLRGALCIGFKTEGFVPISMGLHLLGIKGLNLANLIFHPLNHLGAIRTVVG